MSIEHISTIGDKKYRFVRDERVYEYDKEGKQHRVKDGSDVILQLQGHNTTFRDEYRNEAYGKKTDELPDTSGYWQGYAEAHIKPLEQPSEPPESPQLQEIMQRMQSMEDKLSKLKSQLQTVTRERDELKKENQQLQQKIAQLESGEKPQPAPDSEEDITSEETVTVVEAPEPPAEQTIAVTEIETQVPPNSTWRDKLNNFIQGRSLHNSVMYYRENGILKREETVEERDDRWKAAAVVIGGIALLLLIKRYGFDWGDAPSHDNGVINDIDTGVPKDIDSRLDRIEDWMAEFDGEPDADDDTEDSGDTDEETDEGTGDGDDDSGGSAASSDHVEVFNEQHGDRSVQSILPGNLEQERIGLHERIIDKDTGDVIVEQVTYKQNGPYSETTVAELRSAGYSVTSMPFDIYDTVGPGPRGEIRHYMSVVK